MREIRFRGYSKYNNTWYYGLLGKFDGKYYIECEGGAKPFVEEASIGQYTGFKDKSGKEIYEGDIVKYIVYVDRVKEKAEERMGIIVYNEMDAQFQLRNNNLNFEAYMYNDEVETCEVIGNTYEEKEEQKVG